MLGQIFPKLRGNKEEENQQDFTKYRRTPDFRNRTLFRRWVAAVRRSRHRSNLNLAMAALQLREFNIGIGLLGAFPTF